MSLKISSAKAILVVELALFLAVVAPIPPVVCIDPGHPSEVGRGTHGHMVTEIHMNWLMARALVNRLAANGIHVVLTKRSESEFVTNERRAEIANASHADLFVRLHCDGSAGSGCTVYYPNLPGRDAKKKGPPSMVREESKLAAQSFLLGFARAQVPLKNNGLKTDRDTANGKKHGALIASIHSKVPVLLVEMATLTNLNDEAIMVSSEGQRRMADALAAGVLSALDALKKQKSAFR